MSGVAAGSDRERVRRALLVCGALSSAVYLGAIDVLVPLVLPRAHSYVGQMVSELLAVGSDTRQLLFVPMLVYNLLVFALAVGVWLTAGQRPVVRIASLMLAGYALTSSTGLLVAQMDPRAEGVTSQTLIHIWATALQGVFMFGTFLVGAFTSGPRFRIASFATLGVCLLFGVLAGVDASQDAMARIGLWERISIYAWMLWVVAFAVSLWPADLRPVASRR